MKTSDFRQKWDDFKNHNGYLQRLDPNHPLDFFIGISKNGYEELALVTDIEPAKLSSSKELIVEKKIRKDGRWATQIYSISPENQDIFARLCLDLVECSASSKSELEGLSKVTKRYLAWQKLFSRIKETLPITKLKGLIGELDFVNVLVQQGYTKDDAIAAWVGPDGADRDFILQNTWFENKAIATGKDHVVISSLNQLETDDLGYLTIINIDESSQTDPNAKSVKAIIDKMRELLSDAPDAFLHFEQKLVSAGYIDKKAYEDIFFVRGERTYYRVDNSFPRLITKNVPKEIIRAEYELSIAAIDGWKTEVDQVWR